VRGRFVQVPEVLWQRRYVKIATRARQNAAIYLGSRAPSRYAPVWLVHGLVFARVYALGGAGRPEVGRVGGARLAAVVSYGALSRRIEFAWRGMRLPRKRLQRRAERWWRMEKRKWRSRKRRWRRRLGRVLRR
jgi:hypothetical protein